MWDFLNSQFGLLFSGFVFTTILGSLLSVYFQRAAWRRQARLALYQSRYDEGIHFLDTLAELLGERLFTLQRYLWAIEDTESYDLEQIAREYFSLVANWNTQLRKNRNKIRLLIGETYANTFLDYRDDSRIEQPRSLHYRFVKVGNIVLATKNAQKQTAEAQQEIDELNWLVSQFLEDLTDVFLQRATSLRLLDT